MGAGASRVTMGPRNKRRLIASAITLGVVVVVAMMVLILRPTTRPLSSPTAAVKKPAQSSVTQRLVYGMSKADVMRRVGRPTVTVGACWQYNEDRTIWDGQHTVNAERVCFLGGVYSYSYYKMDGKWFYPTTSLKVGA